MGLDILTRKPKVEKYSYKMPKMGILIARLTKINLFLDLCDVDPYTASKQARLAQKVASVWGF